MSYSPFWLICPWRGCGYGHVGVALVLAAPILKSIDAPREAYATCIKTFESNQLKAKVDPVAYEAAVKTACPPEASAFTAALITYDVAMGTNGHRDRQCRDRDVEDYQLTSVDRYKRPVAHCP